MSRRFSILVALLIGACGSGIGVPVYLPFDGGSPDAGRASDGGPAFDGGPGADGGIRPDGGAAVDGGAPLDGGTPDGGSIVDPVCLRQPTAMGFTMDISEVLGDLSFTGPILSVDRERLVLDAGADAGVQTLRWVLPPLAQPPLTVGQRIALLYRPYNLDNFVSAAIMIRDADSGELLFVGDTGLHRARLDPSEFGFGSLTVAERGCQVFPQRCFEPRNLDLVVDNGMGTQVKVPFGEKRQMSYQGRTYEVINVNVAELAYIVCNVVPGRFRAYVIQQVK